jgi:single-strand DNA-binding protein
VTGKIIEELELRFTEIGTPIVQFFVPTNNVYRTDDGYSKTETTWFRITLTRKKAESACKVLRKGDYIQVVGRLQPKIKIDHDTGNPRGTYDIIADEVIFLPRDNGRLEQD